MNATGDRQIELVPDRDRSGAFTLRIGDTDQSHVDLNDPLRLEFDYVQRIADVVDALGTPGEPLRFVHVGGAGLTLPRYVSVTRPRSAQVVLEPNEQVTEFVRARLPLPKRSGIKVRGVDGRSGIAAMRDDYADIVVIDAYDGPQVPADLVTTEFYLDLARIVTGNGVVLLNLADKAPFGWVRRAVSGLSGQFPQIAVSTEPATLKGRRFGNILVIASRGPLPVGALARRAASSPFPYRVLSADAVQSFTGGAPFTDADTQKSPAPERGATHFA